jgi:hypothetical protein
MAMHQHLNMFISTPNCVFDQLLLAAGGTLEPGLEDGTLKAVASPYRGGTQVALSWQQ